VTPGVVAGLDSPFVRGGKAGNWVARSQPADAYFMVYEEGVRRFGPERQTRAFFN